MELLNECRDFCPGGIWWEMFELILRSLTFLSCQISLRHCWVIMLKNQLLHHNYISKYIQIESSCLHFINISALFGEQKGLKNIKNRPQTSELLHETNFSLKRKLWEARDCSFYSEFYLLGNIWNKSNLWFFFPCESVCICGMGSPVCWAGVCLGTDSSPLWFFWSVCVCVWERESWPSAPACLCVPESGVTIQSTKSPLCWRHQKSTGGE